MFIICLTTDNLEQLRREVDRLVYSSEKSGFTICRLVVPGRGELVTVAETMPGIQPGDRLHLRGRWINHPVHVYQFRADSYSSQLPASANAVRRYLTSSLVNGIGPVLAGRRRPMPSSASARNGSRRGSDCTP